MSFGETILRYVLGKRPSEEELPDTFWVKVLQRKNTRYVSGESSSEEQFLGTCHVYVRYVLGGNTSDKKIW